MNPTASTIPSSSQPHQATKPHQAKQASQPRRPRQPRQRRKSSASSVRHTRAIARDRSKRPTVAPPDAHIEAHLTELIQPATYAHVAAYQARGLRHRTLTLPVMVAFVLSLLWRQIGSVSEAVRALRREGVLWTPPLQVSQQAVSQRLRTFPAALFAAVWRDVLPVLQARWQARTRPLPPVMAKARTHFKAVYALDGSTLDVLLRKVGLLRDSDGSPLAGRLAALLDVASQLPQELWYEADSQAHDQRFWERVLEKLAAGCLLIFDLGFFNFEYFDKLCERQISFITRAKTNTAYRVEQVLASHDRCRDQIIRLGSAAAGSGSAGCQHRMRLVEVYHQGRWYRYLTNVLDPQVLSAADVLALYWQRWRIEDAFNVVKRLLGLAYFYVGSENGVQVQLWATWLLYGVLVDLTDAVAQVLRRPYGDLSPEMVYRGLYHFTQASHRGQASDPVQYLAIHAQELGLLKRKRRSSPQQLLYLTSGAVP